VQPLPMLALLLLLLALHRYLSFAALQLLMQESRRC
jgi:hypothetical protein